MNILGSMLTDDERFIDMQNYVTERNMCILLQN